MFIKLFKIIIEIGMGPYEGYMEIISNLANYEIKLLNEEK